MVQIPNLLNSIRIRKHICSLSPMILHVQGSNETCLKKDQVLNLHSPCDMEKGHEGGEALGLWRCQMAIKFGNKIIIYTKIYYYNKFGPLDSTNGSQITSVPRVGSQPNKHLSISQFQETHKHHKASQFRSRNEHLSRSQFHSTNKNLSRSPASFSKQNPQQITASFHKWKYLILCISFQCFLLSCWYHSCC